MAHPILVDASEPADHAAPAAPALDAPTVAAEPSRQHVAGANAQSVMQSGDRLLRLSELTKLLGVSRSTVYRYVAKGRLPAPVRLSSRCIVWKASVIAAWIAALRTAQS